MVFVSARCASCGVRREFYGRSTGRTNPPPTADALAKELTAAEICLRCMGPLLIETVSVEPTS
jgi:hypothetical protein